MIEDKPKEIYDIFLGLSYSQLKDLFSKAKNKQEQYFYMTLFNMVLQREQEKVMGIDLLLVV